MSKLRFLFVLFSLIVLAAPAGAQRREHGREKERGDETKRDRSERDGDRNERDADDDEDDDEDDDDDDDRRGVRGNGCVDANGNNVCDITRGSIPATLPEMVNAVLVSRGQLTRTGRNWLGGGVFIPRFQKSSTGAPREVTWIDGRRNMRQVWLDTDRDGRADVVRLYRSGKLVRTIRR